MWGSHLDKVDRLVKRVDFGSFPSLVIQSLFHSLFDFRWSLQIYDGIILIRVHLLQIDYDLTSRMVDVSNRSLHFVLHCIKHLHILL